VNEPPTSDEEAVTAELAVLLGALAMGTGGGPATTACVLREVRSLDDAGDDMMGRIGACVADLEAAANAIGGDPGAINYVTAEACARYISISDALPNGGFYQGVTRTSDPQLFAERVVACYAVVEDLRSGGPGR